MIGEDLNPIFLELNYDLMIEMHRNMVMEFIDMEYALELTLKILWGLENSELELTMKRYQGSSLKNAFK